MSVQAVHISVGSIVTMDPERPRAEAFAVQGDRIVAVGSLEEVRSAVPHGATEEVLSGAVLPGLIDAHLHMQRGGVKAIDQLPEGLSLESFMAEMQARALGPDWTGDAPPTMEQRLAGIARIQPYMHALGFTGAVDSAVRVDEFRGYQEAHARGVLTMRITAMPYPELAGSLPTVEDVIERLDGIGVSTGFGDDMLRIGPIKVYGDGEGMKGEALLDSRPWNEDAVASRGETPYFGEQRITDADLARLVQWCVAHGWGVGVHTVGGGSTAKVVDAFAAADGMRPIADLRFQIIHGYLETPLRAIEQAAAHNVVASLQPSIIWSNGQGLRDRLGDARLADANPIRSWLDAGAVVAFGSDGPFFPFDPRLLIWQAATRAISGSDVPLSEGEAISVQEGFVAYTRGAAYAALAEDRRGMIKEDCLADWAQWSEDPTVLAPEDLFRAVVLRTVVGGVTVFRAA